MPPSHPVPTRSLRTLAQLLCVLTMVLSSSAPRAALEEGKNFTTLVPPQPTSQRNKIEVVEFFSYACPHCARFYPLLSAWLAKLPPDVLFRRVPVGFNRDFWINLQRAYYALDATGDLARLDGPLFHALHQERRPLVDASSLAEWVGRNGGDADKFTEAYVSLAVNKESFQADQMAQEFRIEGIPTLAIDGRYVAHAEALPDEEQALNELLANADELIARVRNERAAAKPAGSVPKAPAGSKASNGR
jgi:protein dithiol oxidoreductase (disulfide-forming)